MKLLNVHKYRPGDRLERIDVPGRIMTIVKYVTTHSTMGKLYDTTVNNGGAYLLDEAYLDSKYRRIQ